MYDNTNDPKYIFKLVKTMYYGSNFNSNEDRLMFRLMKFLLKDDNYKKKFNICYLPYDSLNSSKWGILNIVFFKKTNEFNIYDLKYGFNIDFPNFSSEVKDINEIEIDKKSLYFIFKSDKDLYFKLISNGVSRDNIFEFNDMFESSRNNQYFEETFIDFKDDDIFVDGGAYNLENSIDLLLKTNFNIEKIYAFEPILENYNNCLDIKDKYNLFDIDIINLGLWSDKNTQYFSTNASGEARKKVDGDIKIECDSLDNILNGKRVSIIKLDIEGSEYEGLEGAKNTIKEYNPILMICVYHNPNDLFKLMKKIDSINGQYNYYLRHHKFYYCETVLYAIPKDREIVY